VCCLVTTMIYPQWSAVRPTQAGARSN
jgi:hypothetical protein